MQIFETVMKNRTQKAAKDTRQRQYFKKFMFLFLLLFCSFVGAQLLCLLCYFLLNITIGTDSATSIWLLSGFSIIVMIALIFVWNHTARKVFHYPGSGDPVSEATLRQELLRINEFDAPVQAVEKGDNLIMRWNYVDAKWWDLLSRRGASKTYELKIRLNDASKTATLVDVFKSVSWGTGPCSVRLGYFYSCGIWVVAKKEIAFGLTDNFKLGKVYEYSLSNMEIKEPVMNTINANGWSVEFAMW